MNNYLNCGMLPQFLLQQVLGHSVLSEVGPFLCEVSSYWAE